MVLGAPPYDWALNGYIHLEKATNGRHFVLQENLFIELEYPIFPTLKIHKMLCEVKKL